MFKKALILFVTLATSLAYANGGTYAPCATVGSYYAGVGISSDVGKLRYRETDVGLLGVNGDAFAGYGINWYNGYYTGFEIFGTLSSNKGNFVIPAQVKEKGTWGIRMFPGVQITDSTIFYASIGYVRGKFSVTNDNPAINYSTWLDGVQAGLGLQTRIASNFSLRGGWNANGFNRNERICERNVINEYYLDVIYHFA